MEQQNLNNDYLMYTGRSQLSLNTIHYYLSIFKQGKSNDDYILARDFLRKVYGRYFIDIDGVIKNEDDYQFLIDFYSELWNDDDDNSINTPSIYFDSMLAFAQYRKDHPEKFGPPLKLLAAEQNIFKRTRFVLLILFRKFRNQLLKLKYVQIQMNLRLLEIIERLEENVLLKRINIKKNIIGGINMTVTIDN